METNYKSPNFASRVIFGLVFALLSQAAFAVVTINVDAKDIPTVRSGSVSFTDIDGETREAKVTYDMSGNTIIEIEGPDDKIKGGELEIKPRDGTPRFSPVIPMDWDGKKRLRLDVDRQEITSAPGSPSRPSNNKPTLNWEVILKYVDGDQDVPVWGPAAGIQRSPGNEIRALPTDGERNYTGYGAEAVSGVINVIVPGSRAYFGVHHEESDDDGRRTVPIGTDNVFGVFDGEHPTLGTGIFAANSGLEAFYDTEWERMEYKLGFTWPVSSSWGDITVNPRVGLFWGTDEVDWRSNTSFLAFPNLSITTRRDIERDFWGIEAGADFSKPIASGVSFDFSGSLIFQDWQAKLTSHSEIDLLGTPESLRVRTKESDTDIGGRASIGFGYQPNEHVKLGISYDVTTRIGNLGGTSPVDGDDVLAGQRARPDTDNLDRTFRFTVGFRF